MSELLPPVRSDSASSSRRSDSRNSATFEEGGLFGASSSAAGLLESAGRDGGVCDDDDVSESPTMGEDFYKGVEGFREARADAAPLLQGPRPGQSLPPQKAEFSASSAKAARDPRRVAPGEVDALVRNFEEGTSLTELRKQLHASRKSMEDSASALRAAACAAAADFRTGGAL
ncbi:hypothetical protein JL722_720 [Aureococcus anophagefferens]|nr:hypothetical protein JL722_720 [Aureococcus anophagefferens]